VSRTPLFRLLSRSLQLARVANSTGRSAGEVVDLARDGAIARAARARFTRRELLATSAIAGAGYSLGCGKIRELRGKKVDGKGGGNEVAVVGGGIAGLHCAYRLMLAGVPVRLFEGQKRIGGRMWSLRDKFPEGQVCELGGELVDTGHETIRGLCDELGLALDDFETDDPAVSRDIWFFDGRRYGDREVVEAFQPIAAKMDEAWEGIDGEVITYDKPSGGEAIDQTTMAAWLAGAGASGWFYELLDVAYTTEYGLEIAEQSPWNLLMLIDTNPDPFRVFGDSDERFHIRGGNDQIPSKLAEKLGDRIELDTKLEAIAQAADGSYRLTLNSNGAVRELPAERVVLATPFSTLRDVDIRFELPAPKRRAIDELGYGTNAKLMVGFSERLWRTQGKSNGSVLSDLPFQLIWESTRLQPGNAGILVFYSGGQRGLEIGEGTAASHAERLCRDLDRVFPGVAASRIGEARFHWPSFPWVKGSYACYKPGQWTTIAGSEGERVGNLHFAGEHTSYDFQGYMEGGAESGARAAREILVDLGLAQPEPEEPEAADGEPEAEEAASIRRAVRTALG
jgi:monoamine oxidase